MSTVTKVVLGLVLVAAVALASVVTLDLLGDDPGPDPGGDPVAAIDAAWGATGIEFVRAPDLRWRVECGPADEVLGRSLTMDLPLPPGFVAPDTWQRVDASTWQTPQGATVRRVDDGMAEVSAPATSEQVEASDRVVAGPEFMCG